MGSPGLDPIERYVSKAIRSDARTDFALAAAALLGGILVLTVTYYAAFVILWLLLTFLPWHVPRADLWARLGGGALLVLAFVESWRSRRKLFEGYSDETSAGGAALSTGLYALGVGLGPRSIIPLSSGTSRNLVRVAADIACSGPRLLANAVRLVRRGRARSSADFAGCARVLGLALAARGRLTFRQVEDSAPDLDLTAVLEHLSWLRGVVFLEKDPPGLTLTESLRRELESPGRPAGPWSSGPSGGPRSSPRS